MDRAAHRPRSRTGALALPVPLAYGRPMLPTLTFSDDQAEAYDRVAATLLGMGIDLAEGTLTL
ncbi:MAG: hypothetical protein RIR14_600, partial [Pseudomonadota bacterium]